MNILKQFQDQNSRSLDEIFSNRTSLLVFLRHNGCTFCRETLQDLSKIQNDLKMHGVEIVLVHMTTDDSARKLFGKYGLENVSRISDPQKNLYNHFKLKKGSLGQLLGPKVWLRGISALFKGHFVGKLEGDGFQMPGVFLIKDREIVNSFIHKTAADKPNYLELARCEL